MGTTRRLYKSGSRAGKCFAAQGGKSIFLYVGNARVLDLLAPQLKSWGGGDVPGSLGQDQLASAYLEENGEASEVGKRGAAGNQGGGLPRAPILNGWGANKQSNNKQQTKPGTQRK
mmetsp:Transcript_45883/g.99011  ORF Transcript_45883/g.99011 Transcript_45883/m.99011 type:complete len:116 (+) Transcript_45883:12-359(+)